MGGGLFEVFDQHARFGPLDVVGAGHDFGGPAAGLGALVAGVEGVVFGLFAGVDGEDVGGGDFIAGGVFEGDFFAETFGGHGDVVGRRGIGFKPGGEDVAVGDFGEGVFGEDVVEGFAIVGETGIDVDKLLDAIGDAVGDAGDDHAAVAVSDEDDVVEVFVEDFVDDILDVGGEVDVGGGEMDAFALAGEGGAIDFPAVVGEEAVGFAEGPGAAPGAVDEDNGFLGLDEGAAVWGGVVEGGVGAAGGGGQGEGGEQEGAGECHGGSGFTGKIGKLIQLVHVAGEVAGVSGRRWRALAPTQR